MVGSILYRSAFEIEPILLTLNLNEMHRPLSERDRRDCAWRDICLKCVMAASCGLRTNAAHSSRHDGDGPTWPSRRSAFMPEATIRISRDALAAENRQNRRRHRETAERSARTAAATEDHSSFVW